MNIHRVRHSVIEDAARDVGIRIVHPRTERGASVKHDYVLRPAGHRFRNDYGNLCAHGYQAFFDALFKREPGAVVTTAIAKYLGREDFERRRRADLERAQAMFEEECDCDG